jgi:hypothetical protein
LSRPRPHRWAIHIDRAHRRRAAAARGAVADHADRRGTCIICACARVTITYQSARHRAFDAVPHNNRTSVNLILTASGETRWTPAVFCMRCRRRFRHRDCRADAECGCMRRATLPSSCGCLGPRN